MKLLHSIRILLFIVVLSVCNDSSESMGEVFDQSQEHTSSGLNEQLSQKSEAFDSLVSETRKLIIARMQENGTPGAAVALFDRDKTLWMECFGARDAVNRQPVTPETSFSIMSASKMVTAAAVMMAVQDGRLDLDLPITEYLPAFSVNSVHEVAPEKAITLRHLLSHTAGFDGESAGANNSVTGTLPFTDYVKTIRDTWLLVPVNARYLYSNISFDVAGEVLQSVSARPFAQVVREDLFEPLGMSHSFVDTLERNAASGNVASGHSKDYDELPAYFPISASGGVRMSIEDAVRFAQFHLNRGQVNDKTLLRSDLVDQMHARFTRVKTWGKTVWYGLGSYSWQEAGTYAISHYGGGFGFRYAMKWYPEYGIGVIMMNNSFSKDHSEWDVTGKLLQKMVERGIAVKLKAGQSIPLKQFLDNKPEPYLTDDTYQGFLEPTPFRAEWKQYLGRYRIIFGGGFKRAKETKFKRVYSEPDIFLTEKDGHMYIHYSNSTDDPEPVYQHQPGLFFPTKGLFPIGLSDNPPRFGNVAYEKIE